METSTPASVQEATKHFLVDPLQTGAVNTGLSPIVEEKEEVIVNAPPKIIPVDTPAPPAPAVAEDQTDLTEYNDYALLVLDKIEQGVLNIDPEQISKKMTAVEYDNLIVSSYEDKLKSIVEDTKNQLGDAYEYVDLVLRGVNPQVIENAAGQKRIAEIPLDNDENIRQVLYADFKHKGLPYDEEEWKETVDRLFEKGKAKARAEETQIRFKESEEQIIREAKLADEAAVKQEYESRQKAYNDVKSHLERGVIAGLPIDKNEQKELHDYMYVPSVFVTAPNGQKIKVTGIQRDQLAYKDSVEQNLAWALFLKNGAKFGFAEAKGATKQASRFRDALNQRFGSPPAPDVPETGYKSKDYFIKQ